MNQYGYPSQVATPHFDDAVVRPPTFGPEIASLGTLIDTLTTRRMQIEAQRRQDEQLALQQKKEESKEAYYKRKEDILEKKQENERQYQIAQGNQAAMKSLTSSLRPGQSAQPVLMRGPDGAPVWVTPKYVPRKVQQQATAPTAPADPTQQSVGIPTMMGKPLMAPPTLHALVDAQSPEQEQPTVLMDEPEGDTAQAVIENGDDQRTVQLPRRAFPEGATEGERFNQADVNMTGGYGNPFARDVLLDEPEGDTAQAVIETGAGQKTMQMPMSAFPPGAKEGDRFPAEDMQQPPPQAPETPNQGGIPTMMGKPLMAPPLVSGPAGQGQPSAQTEAADEGGYWSIQMPDGKEMRISEADTMAMRRDQTKAKIAELTAAMESPDAQANPQLTMMLARERAMLVGGLDPADRRAMQQAMVRTETSDKDRQSREQIAAESNKTKISIAEMRKKKGSAGKLVMGKAGQPGSAYMQLFSADPFKAEKLASAVDLQVGRMLGQTNWTKLIGTGTNRLDLAMRQISQSGPTASTSHVEAMMNFFGYIRGGVPAKNESDEWRRMTGNFRTWLDSVGNKMGAGNLGQQFLAGRELSAEEMNTISNMSPELRQGLKQAISESQKALRQYATGIMDGIARQFSSNNVRAPAERELVQGKLDGLATYAGVPEKDYFGLKRGQPQGDQTSRQASGGLADKVQQLQKLLGGEQ